MYHDLYGVINEIFLGVGLIDLPHAWIADPALSMYAVIAVDVWKTTPFMTLLILAALQLLPGKSTKRQGWTGSIRSRSSSR